MFYAQNLEYIEIITVILGVGFVATSWISLIGLRWLDVW